MKPLPTVSLLLTNLRLLNYDSDSFPITPDVFTSLTNKGKAFEHIIHHLFHTFDPEECALKLKGCWPAYEPSQSRELRNVVFKWLDDLKKSGRLGGVLIRRTTLDDCCGQRYEELLLALSTMVLRDQIELGQFENSHSSFAYQQAISTQPLQLHLTPLVLAHRYALGNLLEARRNSKVKWSSFLALLDAKEEEIAAMAEQIPEDEEEEQDPQPARPKAFEESIRRKWRNNWLGDPRWLDIMLSGDPELRRDHFLDLKFEEAFRSQQYFAEGRAASVATVSLKGLENQVAEQRRRVEEIRKLREQSLGGGISPTKARISPPTKSASSEQAEKKGLKVKFTKHQNLHLKDMANTPKRNTSRQSEYSELLNSLREEMIIASNPSQRAHDKPEVPVYYHYNDTEQPLGGGDSAPIRDLNDGPEVYHLRINLQDGSCLGSDDSCIQNDMSPQPDTDMHDHDMERMDVDEIDIDPEEKQQRPVHYLNTNPSPISQQLGSEQQTSASGGGSYLNSSDDEASDPLSLLATSQAPSRQGRRASATHHQDKKPRFRNSYGFRDEPPRRDSAPVPQLMLEPKRPRIRNSIGFDDDLYAEQIVARIAGAPFSPDRPSPEKPKSTGTLQQLSAIDSPMSLYEPSMIGFGDSTMSLANPSFRVDESRLVTPARAQQVATTPTEDLLRSGDYNSVFKSRPKIALSPTFSPSPCRDVPMKGLNIDMAGDGIVDDDSDEVMEYISSPLVSKVRG